MRRQRKRALILRRTRRAILWGGLILAAFLAFWTAGASPSEEVVLSVSFRGLRLNQLMQWQTVPLNGRFEVFAGDSKLGEITANRTAEQQGAGQADALTIGKQDAGKGLSLRPVAQSMPGMYVCDAEIDVAWNGESSLRVDVLAYAREGLFRVETRAGENLPSRSAQYAVLDAGGQAVLTFATDDRGDYTAKTTLPEGAYTLHQTLSPDGTLPAGDVAFTIAPYFGTQESVAALTVENEAIPHQQALTASMTARTQQAGDLYAADQTAEFLFTGGSLGNTLPLYDFALNVMPLTLMDAAGNSHPDQSGKEIQKITVTPGTAGIQAKVLLFDAAGNQIGEKPLAPGQELPLNGLGAVSARIVYLSADGEPLVPAGFVAGEVRLAAGLGRRTPNAGVASVSAVSTAVKASWQYQYPGRDGMPVTASGEAYAADASARVLDSRAMLTVAATAKPGGRASLVVRNESAVPVESPRLAVKLPDGWRVLDGALPDGVATVSRGEKADMLFVALSGPLAAGREWTAEFGALFGAAEGAGEAFIGSGLRVAPTLDNPTGLGVWGEAAASCPAADLQFGFDQQQTYANIHWTAANEAGMGLSLKALGYPGAGGEASLSENGDGLLLLETGGEPAGWHMIALPGSVRLTDAPAGPALVTTDGKPGPDAVWTQAEAYTGDYANVTAVAFHGAGSATLPVRTSGRPGRADFRTVSRTGADSGYAEGTVSINIGRNASLSGRLFDDMNGNGRQDDGEQGAAGQLVLWRGGNTNVSAYTNGQGAFDFSGAASNGEEGQLYVSLPENTAIAGLRGPGGLYMAGSMALDKQTGVEIGFSRMCALYGTVYDAETGAGLAGITVDVTSGGQPVATAITDALGGYRFGGLAQGRYQVSVTLKGDASSAYGFYTGDGYAQISGAAASLPEAVLAYGGEVQLDAPVRGFGAVSLLLGGESSGVAGIALSRDGAPVAQLSPAGDGSYQASGLFSGAYVLHFDVNPGLAVRAEGANDWQKGSIALDTQVATGVQTQIIADVTRTSVLRLALSGSGIAGSRVTVSGPETLEGVLDESGQCAFYDLIPGTYTATVFLPKDVLGDQGGMWQVELRENSAAASLAMEVAPGTETAFPVAQLVKAATLSGAVFTDSNLDGSMTSGEAALSGVAVSLQTEQNGNWTEVQKTAAGEDGQFLFDSLAPGRYRLTAALPGGKTLASQDALMPFDLGSGENRVVMLGAVSSASITANAFWDSDNNGLQGIYERAIEGTLVEVLAAEGSDDALYQGYTDRSGQTTFAGVTPGSYRIRFTLPSGYWLSMKGDKLAQDRNTVPMADSSQGVTEVFTLYEGTTAGFGVGGFKTAAISGRVWLDEDEDGVMREGEPGLAGCLITLKGNRYGYTYTYTTDDTGAYALTARPDTYILSFQGPEGMAFTRYSSTGGDSRSIITTEGAGAGERQFLLESGTREENKNVGFIRGVVLEGLAYLDENYNGAWDEGEAPLAGVTLELERVSNSKPVGSTKTGPDGIFRFDSLRGGDYRLRAVLPNTGVVFSRTSSGGGPYVNLFGRRIDRRENTVALSASAGERLLVGVGAVLPAALSGSVFVDDNYNGALDQGEELVPGVTVKLAGDDGAVIASTKTNASGQYAFDQLMPMAYTLIVEKPAGYMFTIQGGGEARNRVISSAKTEGATETIAVPMGGDVNSIHAGVIRPAGVFGKVFGDLDDNGLQDGGEGGLPGVTVTLLDAGGNEVDSVVTGEDGAYAFDELTPGGYMLSYLLPEDSVYSPQTDGGSQIHSDSLAAFGEGFSLKMGESLRAPLCGALTLARVSGTAFHDTNANGALDAGENTMASVRIFLTSSRTGQAAEAVTGPDGAFLLEGLRPGPYAMTITLPGGMVFTRPSLDALAGDALSQEYAGALDIRMGDNLSGRLVGGVLPASFGGTAWLDENNNGLMDSGEAFLPGLAIKVVDSQTGNTFADLVTDENGQYGVPVIRPGTYAIQVTLPENCIAADTAAGESLFADRGPGLMELSGFTLREGEEITGTKAGIRRFTSIAGRVWADQGGAIAPLGNTQVSLYDVNQPGTPLHTMVTGEDGVYRFDGNMPGDYAIGAMLPEGYLFVRPGDARLADNVSIITDMAGGMGDGFQLHMGQDQLAMDIGAVRTGMLGDFAWLDTNGNGLQDSGEPGIPGLTVELMQEGVQVGQAVTDAYGYYLFDAVYPAATTVRVSMYQELLPAQTRTDFPLLVSALYGYEGNTAFTGDVMVTSGGKNFNCDLGFVLKEGAKKPAAMVEPPRQNWE